MLLLGFYFMLHSGEYAYTDNERATPFRLKHGHLFVRTTRLNHLTGPLHLLSSATAVALEFDRQKNGVRGEVISLSRSGHPIAAVVNRVKHLRQHNATLDTPLYCYWNTSSWAYIISKDLTNALRTATLTVGPQEARSVSARSLHSAGAMALYCAGMDKTTIQLLGRWKSEELLRYLHAQAFPVTAQCAQLMLQHGNFAMIPTQPLP
jgi:hypothetical protein